MVLGNPTVAQTIFPVFIKMVGSVSDARAVPDQTANGRVDSLQEQKTGRCPIVWVSAVARAFAVGLVFLAAGQTVDRILHTRNAQ